MVQRTFPAHRDKPHLHVGACCLQVLKSDDPYTCLEHFAKAVEIDEMGCGWKKQFENRLEMIGEQLGKVDCAW